MDYVFIGKFISGKILSHLKKEAKKDCFHQVKMPINNCIWCKRKIITKDDETISLHHVLLTRLQVNAQ